MSRYIQGVLMPDDEDSPDMVQAFASYVDLGVLPKASGLDTNGWPIQGQFDYAPQGHVHVENRDWQMAGGFGIMGARGIDRPLHGIKRDTFANPYAFNWTEAGGGPAPTPWGIVVQQTNGSLDFKEGFIEFCMPITILTPHLTTPYQFEIKTTFMAYAVTPSDPQYPSAPEYTKDDTHTFTILARYGSMNRTVIRGTSYLNANPTPKMRRTFYAYFNIRILQAPANYNIRFGEAQQFYLERTM